MRGALNVNRVAALVVVAHTRFLNACTLQLSFGYPAGLWPCKGL